MLWIPTVPYASAGHTNLAGCAPVLTGSRSFQRAEGQTYRGILLSLSELSFSGHCRTWVAHIALVGMPAVQNTILAVYPSVVRLLEDNPEWVKDVELVWLKMTKLPCNTVPSPSSEQFRSSQHWFTGAVTLSVIAGVGVARRSHRRSAEAFGNAELLQLETWTFYHFTMQK